MTWRQCEQRNNGVSNSSSKTSLVCWFLCVWLFIQATLLCVIAIRHGYMTQRHKQDLQDLMKRSERLLRQPCLLSTLSKKAEESPRDGRSRRNVAGVKHLAAELEDILARHCSNTSRLCLPGRKGESGQPGLKGTSGSNEFPGETGAKGIQGSTGSSGQRGTPGSDGLPGSKGMMGVPGKRGPKGDAGQRGLSGARGDAGSSGSDGHTGITGIMGDPGVPGPTGKQGPDRQTGQTGDQGPRGVEGQDGGRGRKGLTGPQRSCLCRLPSPQQRVISACDFERDSCDWVRPSTTYGWRRAGFPRQSDFTGPSTDHTTQSPRGHYMYTNAFFGLSEMTSEMTSRWMTGGKDYCLELLYYLHGRRAGSLALKLETKGGHVTNLWQVTGDQGAAWREDHVTVTSHDDFRLVLAATFGGHFTADVFVDDITVLSGMCS